MPLFMDIHHIESIPFTEEDAYRAHLRDLAVQDQYGLVYRKYYLNIPQGTICCLMEGPSKEACVISHKRAHGIGPCNVIEVSPETEFHPYLGEGSKNEKDLALTLSGEVDTGYRTLMQIDWYDRAGSKPSPFQDIKQYIRDYEGNVVQQPQPLVITSFIKPQKAISCAVILRDYIKALVNPALFTIAVVTGKPVDDSGQRLFDQALGKLADYGRMGRDATITIDQATRDTFEQSGDIDRASRHIDTLVNGKENLLRQLTETVEAHLDNPNFRTEDLQMVVGASKAQTYRKIKGLTGQSPNGFIREVRLRRSLGALKKNGKTVAEIAYAHGFNSPTYFTRVFKERFGVLPTEFAKVNAAV